MNVTFKRYPELEQFLKTFVEFIATSLSTVSIILFGGITLDDFSMRYSDIDLVVVLEKTLWGDEYDTFDEILQKLVKINKELTQKLNIYFIPSILIENPRVKYNDVEGIYVKNLQQDLLNKYPLSIIDDFMIHHKSKILYGEDLRKKFPIPPVDCFWIKFLEDLKSIELVSNQHPFQYADSFDYNFATNWILYFPRMLYSIQNNDVIGKLKGAYWFSNEFPGTLGDFVVEVAMCRQKNISLSNMIELVERSRKLLLFSIEKAFDFKGINIPELEILLKEDAGSASFTRVFMEIRNYIPSV